MSAHVSIKIGRHEWRYTLTNLTPERKRTDVNKYFALRALVGADWDEGIDINHRPIDGICALLSEAMRILPIDTEL